MQWGEGEARSETWSTEARIRDECSHSGVPREWCRACLPVFPRTEQWHCRFARRNPRIRGAESRFRRRQHTADQIAAASPDPPACTLSRHADTYGAQLRTSELSSSMGFSGGYGTVVPGGACAGVVADRTRRPASSLRTAPDLSFPIIDRCVRTPALRYSLC